MTGIDAAQAGEDVQPRWDVIGAGATRLGLVLVFLGIGAMTFTADEANAIHGLVSSSPLTTWLYVVLSAPAAAKLIGAVKIFAALLMLAVFARPRLGALGAALMMATLAVTASFPLTAPVIEPSVEWPALNVLSVEFLLNDLALLGATVCLLARDLKA